MFQPFYEETKKPTKSKISFCQVLQLPNPFIYYTRTHVLMARSCIFFFSGGFVGRPATDHGNAMVPFLLRSIRRMLRDDDFDHTDLGDAFGDLRCPDLKRRHFTDR